METSQLGAACKAVFHNEDMLVKLFDIARMFIIKIARCMFSNLENMHLAVST